MLVIPTLILALSLVCINTGKKESRYKVQEKEHKLVFSARVAQKGRRKKRINEIEVGSVVKSRIVNVVDFGIFVDLDGIDGLVHKSEIGWERLKNPTKQFKIGEEIEVKVLSVDKEKERVSLSRKELIPNPWLKLADKYKIGDLVEGEIVSVLEFGAFVELKKGLQGLVHISEIGYLNTDDPKSAVKKGDPVLVKIMAINPNRERVSLSMRRVPISEQMDWIMNLDEVIEGDRLDASPDDQNETEDSLVHDPDLVDEVGVENETEQISNAKEREVLLTDDSQESILVNTDEEGGLD